MLIFSDMTAQIAIGIATVVISALTIFAIIRGPILALRIQRKLDEEHETRNRKLWIFKTLMA